MKAVIDITQVSGIRQDVAPSEDLTAGLGAALRELRTRKRITQQQMAEFVGLERTSITNIEMGKQKLAVVTLMKMAGVLGVEVCIQFKDAAIKSTAGGQDK